MTINKLLKAALLSAYLLGGITVLQEAKAQVVGITERVRIGQLENGLKYYIHPNSKPENKVELRLVINAGSVLEDDKQRGFAHFTEHMLFNGTKNYPKNELVKYLQSLGIKFGADLNAYTAFDETVYILPVPTTDKSNLDKGLDVLEDWAAQATFDHEEIDAERGVIIEESRGRKGAEGRFLDKYFPKIFAGSKYGERLPIGVDSIILHGSYEDLKRFYTDWYRPDLMAVIIVGDVTFEEGEALVKKHFGPLQNPQNKKARTYESVPPFAKNEAMVLTDKEAAMYSIDIMFDNKESKTDNTIQNYRKKFVRSIFTSILNDRLSDATETADPPYAMAYASINGYARNYENFNFTIRPVKDVNKSLTEALEILKTFSKYGVTQQELDIQSKDYLSYYEKMYNERNTTNSSRFADEYVNHFLKNEPIPGIEQEYEYAKTILGSITVDEVNKLAQEWLGDLNSQKFFALIKGPDTKTIKLPTDRELVSNIETVLKSPAKQYSEKVIKSELISKDLKPGTISNEAYDAQLDVYSFELNNGIKVNYKKTNFKSDEIRLSAMKQGGSNKYAATDKENAMAVNMFLDALGYGEFTPSELTKTLAGKNVSVGLSMADYYNQISGSSNVADLEIFFQLLYLKLNGVRKDQDLFNGQKNTLAQQLAFLTANPQYSFLDTFGKALYNNDPKAPITIPNQATFDKLNLNNIEAIYNHEFKNADGFTFYFVGNIDEGKLKELSKLYLANLETKNTKPHFVDNGLRPVKGYNELNYKKGQDDQSLILQVYHGELPYNEDLALKGTILKEIINMRITEEIREKMGAIYSGGMSFQFDKYPYGNYSFTNQLPCGSENVQKVIEAMAKEISNIRTNGIEKSYLDKAIKNMKETTREGQQTNSYWLSAMTSVYFDGKSKERITQFNERLDKITVDDIKATANLLFGGSHSNLFQAVLLPETAKK